MKTLFMFLSALLLTLAINGQETTGKSTTKGKVTYEDKVKLEIKLEGDAAQFAESLPKEQVTTKVLYFNADYSLFQADEVKKPEDVMAQETGHMTMRMIIAGGNDKVFIDLKSKKKLEQKEFMSRIFLIEGDLGSNDWKLTGNTRTILGYICQEASREEKDKKISAWFSPNIPVSAGPAGYAGLPGLVLKIDINDGKRTITAVTIDPDFSDASLIVKPKDGKKVTADEYKKIVDEKMKEMGAEGGEGGAHIMIRIKN